MPPGLFEPLKFLIRKYPSVFLSFYVSVFIKTVIPKENGQQSAFLYKKIRSREGSFVVLADHEIEFGWFFLTDSMFYMTMQFCCLFSGHCFLDTIVLQSETMGNANTVKSKKKTYSCTLALIIFHQQRLLRGSSNSANSIFKGTWNI